MKQETLSIFADGTIYRKENKRISIRHLSKQDGFEITLVSCKPENMGDERPVSSEFRRGSYSDFRFGITREGLEILAQSYIEFRRMVMNKDL